MSKRSFEEETTAESHIFKRLCDDDEVAPVPRPAPAPAEVHESAKMREFVDCTKYYTDAAGVKAMLAEHGVAIIPNVLDAASQQKMIDDMWNALETLSSTVAGHKIIRADPSTYKHASALAPLHKMMFQHWIGHTSALWDVRTHPKILEIASVIHGVHERDLLCSFDGASYGIYGHYKSGTSWYHVDKSFKSTGAPEVQSWVTALDVPRGAATLTVFPGSNKLFDQFRSWRAGYRRGKQSAKNPGGYPAEQWDAFSPDEQKARDCFGSDNWYRFSPEELQWYADQGCKPIAVSVPAGSQVFWLSSTVHCGQEALPECPNSMRCVVYVCYAPRAMATEANLKKKREAFMNERTTTHKPHEIHLFSKNPRFYGGPVPNITIPPRAPETPIMRRLAGFDQ